MTETPPDGFESEQDLENEALIPEEYITKYKAVAEAIINIGDIALSTPIEIEDFEQSLRSIEFSAVVLNQQYNEPDPALAFLTKEEFSSFTGSDRTKISPKAKFVFACQDLNTEIRKAVKLIPSAKVWLMEGVDLPDEKLTTDSKSFYKAIEHASLAVSELEARYERTRVDIRSDLEKLQQTWKEALVEAKIIQSFNG